MHNKFLILVLISIYGTKSIHAVDGIQSKLDSDSTKKAPDLIRAFSFSEFEDAIVEIVPDATELMVSSPELGIDIPSANECAVCDVVRPEMFVPKIKYRKSVITRFDRDIMQTLLLLWFY